MFEAASMTEVRICSLKLGHNTKVRLDLTEVRLDHTGVSLDLTEVRLDHTGVSLDLTGVRLDLTVSSSQQQLSVVWEMVWVSSDLQEQRRAALDPRHTHIMSCLRGATGLGEKEVEEALVTDPKVKELRKFPLIDEFFAANGTRRIMFFCQSCAPIRRSFTDQVPSAQGQKRLFLTTGTAEPLSGQCLFFLRTCEKEITVANVQQEVNFGMLDSSDGSVLQSLYSLFSDIMVPALKSNQSWGCILDSSPAVQDFLWSLDRFLLSLNSVRLNLDQKFHLEPVELPEVLETLVSPKDYTSAANSSEVVEHLEDIVSLWTNQIQQVLIDSEQLRREPDDAGPETELEHWKTRTVLFNSLLEELKMPCVKKSVGVLQMAKSRVLQQWRKLDADITLVANEAKDNVKFLYTLEKIFEPLTSRPPLGVAQHLSLLMSSLKMIYTVSPFYNSPQRMTSLLLKVTNQMINTCRRYLCGGVANVWDHPRAVLLQRISECCELNKEYQKSFHTVQEDLRGKPNHKPFNFSEHYIFGKFDAFCCRLQKISQMVLTLEKLSSLQHVKVEGVDRIYSNYQTIVSSTKNKSYDVLDHRKREVEKLLPLLSQFQTLPGLELKPFNLQLLQMFHRELEQIRKVYEREKEEPRLGRNMPPVAGRILWSRQLFSKMEVPMMLLKPSLDSLKGPELSRLVRLYNRTAVVLLQYELLHLHHWRQEAGGVNLTTTLLDFSVNLSPGVLELLEEARWMKKMGLEVPQSVEKLSQKESQIRALNTRLLDLLHDYSSVLVRIPALLVPLLQPFITEVESALSPGLSTVTWTSLNTQAFVDSVQRPLLELKQVCKCVSDILDCRINRLLQRIGTCTLLPLQELPRAPEHPGAPQATATTPDQLLTATEIHVKEAAAALTWDSQQVERYVYEIIEELKEKMKPANTINLEDPFVCLQPDPKHRTRCTSCLPCFCYTLISQLCLRNTESLIKATKLSLDSLRRRLTVPKLHNAPCAPLFRTEVHLSMPNPVLRPSLNTIQSSVNKLVSLLLSATKDIPVWRYMHLQLTQTQEEQAAAEDISVKPPVLRSMERAVSEHKDISKVVLQLGASVSSIRSSTVETLNGLSLFSELWLQEPNEQVQIFLQSDPLLSDFTAQIQHYSALETRIQDLPALWTVGWLVLDLEQVQRSLRLECCRWKQAFGAALSLRASTQMEQVSAFVGAASKRLQRPITDLEDVRNAMATLREIREEEIRIEASIAPIEESFSLLLKHQLLLNNSEKTDVLMYNWRQLQDLAVQTQDSLIQLEPRMKTELLMSVKDFRTSVEMFYREYQERGPGVEGVSPIEASERLQIFQRNMEDLWSRFSSCSGGEELFGLPVTEYQELQRIRREMSLLSKLYSLYDCVSATVRSFHELQWTQVDPEQIQTELQDFHHRMRTLPAALKDWPAFRDLKKTIEDFTETCPLLCMMASKALLPRHWERLSEVTAHTFQFQSNLFCLGDVMKAPLLKYKDEIEDVCVSAVKQKDIESKLMEVQEEWSAHVLSFASFRSRGELLLKGSEVTEKLSIMEDSLMVLSSLLSNRYNAPFKAQIQQWVQKLSGSAEVLEKWLSVQNLWVYLEAVFVGGDIAKQLPQEAQRFQVIDKSWQRIMQRAHDLPNMIQCCVSDETLAQLLTHLLEQLELSQKSLSGYLEKKRLIFPRFFFVSDPALLEILGQASDSHTIQRHLLSLFDNVNRVVFSEKIYDQMLRFESQEGESVELCAPVMAQGSVEVWLGQLLSAIRLTLRSIIRRAHFTISEPELNMEDFQRAFPAQVGLLGLQMVWTRDAEEALDKSRGDKKVMSATNQKFLQLLNELIDMTTRDLSRNERTKYETLITIHVHQRDIFNELVLLGVRSVSDFQWKKQSRFYFLEETDHCLVQITDVQFCYCNEYLGCTERLVITPLTDRCYITLAQALGMSLGGAPAGPAGTGKTETTKDMGRCLGKYVVVFNCSDQMDYRGLGRIYKGLAQSGAWGCFDEFNRIELPVLSVAAQQIYIVLQCKKHKKKSFVFSDGDEVAMDPEFGIFLTMNPGYAGRQELPENLKVQFRTVAMMVPDRAIIMRVKLASAGFKDNQALSRKFYTLYKLCEEQLSKQVHYDFGLRNILSVLRTLGSVKRASPEEPEKTVVMRVLRDMNLSKLVDEDEPLFMSLINDLFPGIVVDKAEYPELLKSIHSQCERSGLVPHSSWVLKLVQLYETQRVRHGMMALGPSGSGKSSCIRTLMAAFGDAGAPHREMRMNPKSITAAQMFGTLDPATNDWTDGIFSTLWRRTLRTKKGDHVWIVLDGPVDAIWIENLNSVLDDNKTLTLANGDRIPMATNCKIVFEPHNIDNASPATVSRNGMVFMSESVLGWRPLLQTWTRTLPEGLRAELEDRFNHCYQDLLEFVYTALSPKMNVLENMYIMQTIDLLQGLLSSVEDKHLSKVHISCLFTFALLWSLGALLELEDRDKMEVFLKSHSSGLDLPQINPGQTIFEFTVNQQGAWEHWANKVPDYVFPTDQVLDYSSVLVPNVDNVRTDFLLKTISKQKKHVLLIGEQGTAKTAMIQGYLGNLDPESHGSKSLSFSSATLPIMFQHSVESYIEKRVGTTYGPPGGRSLSLFIDDINMPLINEWGDQITNELVRQLIEQEGFYSLERPGDFLHVVDIQVVAAMIHPGGGRNDIPQRLKRHFSIFNCTLPSNPSIDRIFSTLAQAHFCPQRGFSADVCALACALVPTTRRVWQEVKAKMLPSPAKFHYIFNLRDLSRIWQGLLCVQSEVCVSERLLSSLFHHEVSRVIADRFIDQSEHDAFEHMITTITAEHHGKTLTEHAQWRCSFVDFLRDTTGDEEEEEQEPPRVRGGGARGPQSERSKRLYEPVPSLDVLAERLSSFQLQYNETVRGGAMDLVFFEDAMVHLMRISRVLRTPRGNALLVGVGGSGKQSLTRLASFIAGYESFQITLTRSYGCSNLLEDLRTLYRLSGHQGRGVTFIFTDNHIKDEAFLEYLNNVLASGDLSNLFPRDELDDILQDLIPALKRHAPKRAPTNENLYEHFLTRVRANLHVVLCFSPVGDKFRSRALKFPGLVSGCTVDWFQRWPKDALVSVSRHFMSAYSELRCPLQVKESVVQSMGDFQDVVAEKCTEYFQRFRRQTYVTPRSFLSFVNSYKLIYSEKVEHVGTMAQRMDTGLKKLMEAEVSVSELSEQLVVKEQELASASLRADAVLLEVTEKARAAEEVKRQVQKVKDRAQIIVDEIEADKSVAESKLEAAKPALEAAEAALQTIKPGDISTVRKLQKPPHLIMRIMDAVLLLFQRKIDSVTPDPERPCPRPSWSEAMKLMQNSSFLSTLLHFSKDSITEETVELVAPYLQMDDYNMDSAKRTCGNVAGLCSWTQAMVDFFSINKEVLPLKSSLALQESRLVVAQAELCKAQDQLDQKQRDLDQVQALYDAAMKEKQDLEDDAQNCRRKMSNATELIQGLGGEKVRWTSSSSRLQAQMDSLVGDVLLSAGFLSYAGPFNQEFRGSLLRLWKDLMKTQKIPFSQDVDVAALLVDSATKGEWALQGLPTDELSVQNATIVTKAPRYPLLIDPQGQGQSWIESRERECHLQVTSLNHKYFRTHLEDCLSLGRPLLVEDVQHELDPVLDNVLDKNFIKSGSSFKVKVGDKEVDLLTGFCLYITTKLSNPVFSPEVSARVAVVDFTVTHRGLEEQLLGRVILIEKQELETRRVTLVEEVTMNRRTMQELEDSLLLRLSSTKGSLVEDESLIEVLHVTKKTANEVSEKLSIAADTEVKINQAREEFRPVATRGSILYFLIVEMSAVNTMYQTSLVQFLKLFHASMRKSAVSAVTSRRISNIVEYLTLHVFQFCCRGLYEEHKLLFTLLLALKIDLQRSYISQQEVLTFIKGGASLELNSVEPKPKRWILDQTWLNLVQLSTLTPFSHILRQVAQGDRWWKAWFDESAPEEAPLPDGYDCLDPFRRLLLVRSWCPDRTIAQARRYISSSLGPVFTEGLVLDLESLWLEGDCRTPLLCLLSMGSDPTESIERLAKSKGAVCHSLSMGQAQEVHARRLLSQSQSDGGWLLLQNCHLGLHFLEELLQSVSCGGEEEVQEGFRVWVTTDVHDKFPITFLQSSIKFTNEPPQGMKAGLKRTFGGLTQDQLDVSDLPQWRPLLYALAFLHTTVQERRKFGPLGWNIPYEFNQADFTSSLQFVQNLLENMDLKRGLDWACLRYMLGEVQYGGRVTDDLDKCLLTTFTHVWFTENLFSQNFCFYKDYVLPGKTKNMTQAQILEHVENLPPTDSPEVFGLHPNADITYQTNLANQTLSMIVNIQPKDSGGGTGETREENVRRSAHEMLQKIPPDYASHQVRLQLQRMGPLQPMNIFLKQEVDRMQRIIIRVRSTLTDLQLAIDGCIVMSEPLREALDALFDARVPQSWLRLSWDSASIGFWFSDLLERNLQLCSWISSGRPNQFWLTGFFNPQGFLTAMRQETARLPQNNGWALDSVLLSNDVTKMMKEDVLAPPPEHLGGVYIYGLFVDGAGWDRRNARLTEAPVKVRVMGQG
uniref:AAA+ ATPase domain-containing protein n=1 Tax=Knipowitschia caucasica TaxID=637954 RepID=A0AAV2L334_KNICA